MFPWSYCKHLCSINECSTQVCLYEYHWIFVFVPEITNKGSRLQYVRGHNLNFQWVPCSTINVLVFSALNMYIIIITAVFYYKTSEMVIHLQLNTNNYTENAHLVVCFFTFWFVIFFLKSGRNPFCWVIEKNQNIHEAECICESELT